MFWDCDKEKLDEPFAHLDSGNIHEIEKGLLAMLHDMMRCGTLKIKVYPRHTTVPTKNIILLCDITNICSDFRLFLVEKIEKYSFLC